MNFSIGKTNAPVKKDKKQTIEKNIYLHNEVSPRKSMSCNYLESINFTSISTEWMAYT